MLDWYKYCIGKGWALGICTQPCNSGAAGPPEFILRWAADHGRRHRPGGMVLTDYGLRSAGHPYLAASGQGAGRVALTAYGLRSGF